METKLTEAQLKINAEALGMNPEDRGALMVAAMVSDPDFRERITRLHFNRALEMVQKKAAA